MIFPSFASRSILLTIAACLGGSLQGADPLCYPTGTCTVSNDDANPHWIEIPANPAQVRMGMDFVRVRVKCVKPDKPPEALDESKAGKPLGSPGVFLAGAGCATQMVASPVPGEWNDFGTCGPHTHSACEKSHKE